MSAGTVILISSGSMILTKGGRITDIEIKRQRCLGAGTTPVSLGARAV